MKISVTLSVSRRIRARTGERREQAKEMRLNTKASAMLISVNGKKVFKFLNRK